jgi:hypothetical protein
LPFSYFLHLNSPLSLLFFVSHLLYSGNDTKQLSSVHWPIFFQVSHFVLLSFAEEGIKGVIWNIKCDSQNHKLVKWLEHEICFLRRSGMDVFLIPVLATSRKTCVYPAHCNFPVSSAKGLLSFSLRFLFVDSTGYVVEDIYSELQKPMKSDSLLTASTFGRILH